jgi:hypothetical protein
MAALIAEFLTDRKRDLLDRPPDQAHAGDPLSTPAKKGE